MIFLTRGVAILDLHTRLACLEHDNASPRHAALGTAVAHLLFFFQVISPVGGKQINSKFNTQYPGRYGDLWHHPSTP
jgi:hypothetical protein